MRARTGAGGSWGDNGRLWRVVACVVRAMATRGCSSCPCGGPVLATVGHCAERFSLSVKPEAKPNNEFCRDENFMTMDFQRKFRTSKLKSNVPATTLVKGSCANSQPKLSNIITKIGLSGCQSIGLRKICIVLKC